MAVIAVSVILGFIFMAGMGGAEDVDDSGGYSQAAGDDILVAYLLSWEDERIFNYKYNGQPAECISDGKYICYTDYSYDAGDRNYGPGVCHRDTSYSYMHIEEYASYGIIINSGEYDDVDVDKIDMEIVDGVFYKMLENNFIKEVETETAGYTLTDNQKHALVCVAYQYGNVNGAGDFMASGGTDRSKFWVSNGKGGRYYPFKEGGGKGGNQRVNANWQLFSEGIYETRSGQILDPADFANSSGSGNGEAKSDYTTFDNFVFIGDSYTVGLKSHVSSDEKFNGAKYYAEEGEAPDYWVSNFSSLPDSANGVCVLLGVNGTSQISQMEKLITKLVTKYGSGVPIYIQRVFHVGSGYTYGSINADDMNKNIDTYNNSVKSSITSLGYDNVYFIDTTTGCEENGYLKYKDGTELHLNSEGYKIWANNLKSVILK